MYTEQQAKERACPQQLDVSPEGDCIGRGCMAWRWVPLSTSDVGYMDALRKASAIKGEDGKPLGQKWAAAYVNANRAEFGLPEQPTTGFCGLAGTP